MTICWQQSFYPERQVWFIPLADKRGVCRQNCEIPWQRVPYLSTLEVWSRQIHVYVYLYPSTLASLTAIAAILPTTHRSLNVSLSGVIYCINIKHRQSTVVSIPDSQCVYRGHILYNREYLINCCVRNTVYTNEAIIIIIIIMTFIPRILASASNAPKQSHCQTGKSLAVYKKPQKSQ